MKIVSSEYLQNMLCTQIVVFVLLTFRTILVHNMFCRCCELLKNIYLYHISLFSRTLWKILPLCMVNIHERFIIKSELWWRAYSIHFPQYWMITCSSDQTTNPESANSEFFLQSKYFSLPLQKVKSIIETHFREKNSWFVLQLTHIWLFDLMKSIEIKFCFLPCAFTKFMQ